MKIEACGRAASQNRGRKSSTIVKVMPKEGKGFDNLLGSIIELTNNSDLTPENRNVDYLDNRGRGYIVNLKGYSVLM